jgi:uncharacterized tellurite resistance protein B-like protein
MQMLSGARQKMSAEQQAVAAAAYIKETDLLAKITGKNRQEQEQSRESAMAEERYAGYKLELEQRAAMGDKAAAEQLKQTEATQIMLDKMAPETRKGFLNILSGSLNTPEAQKLLLTMPNAAAVAGKETFTQAEFMAAAQADARKNIEGAGKDLAKIGANNDTFLAIQEQQKIVALGVTGTVDEQLAAANQAQKVTDKTTQSMTDLQDSNRASRDKLQDLINAGITPVTTGMKGLANAADKTIESMTKLANTVGVTTKKRDEPGAAAQAAPRSAAAPSAPGGAAAGGTAAGGKSSAAPAKPSSRPPEESGAGTAAAAADLTKIMKFTANSGSRQAFDGLNSTFKDSVIAAATDYNKLTGGMLQINSAKRDPADQQRLWDESVAAGREGKTASGMPIGKPGRSLHERGEAIDIQNYRDPAAVAALNKYGLSQKVPNDPVHFQAANGGVVPPLPGGVNVLAGEAGQSEAVVPLPDGKTIPVQMVGNDAQMSMMSAQLDRLDQMVRIMQNQVGVSEKILKYAQ